MPAPVTSAAYAPAAPGAGMAEVGRSAESAGAVNRLYRWRLDVPPLA